MQEKLGENDATKHVRLGSRSEKLLNIHGPLEELKNAVSELSIKADGDSHPDLSAEELETKNADKFSLDFFQCRAFELKTLSRVLGIGKVLAKSHTRLILQDNALETYDTSLVDVCVGAGAVLNLGSINQGRYERVAKLSRINEVMMGLSERE